MGVYRRTFSWSVNMSRLVDYVFSLLNLHRASFLCKVPHIFKIFPFLKYFIVCVTMVIVNREYSFYCIYSGRMSPDNITLIHWIKIDHVLFFMTKINRCRTVIDKFIVTCSRNYALLALSLLMESLTCLYCTILTTNA